MNEPILSPPPAPEAMGLRELRRELRLTRLRAARAEASLAEAQRLLEDARAETAQEAERFGAAIREAETRIRRAEIRALAVEAGAVDPDDVAKLLPPLEGADAETLREAVRALLRAKPHLLRRPVRIDAGWSGAAAEPFDMNQVLRRFGGR